MTDQYHIHPATLRAPHGFPPCPDCDQPMRLYGIEPHMRLEEVDLHTYGCDRCGIVEAMLAPLPPVAKAGAAR